MTSFFGGGIFLSVAYCWRMVRSSTLRAKSSKVEKFLSYIWCEERSYKLLGDLLGSCHLN